MISEPTLARALEDGVISPAQLARLREIEASASPQEPQDEEKLRLVTGFGDIFVTIGVVLFLGAFFVLTHTALLGGPTAALTAAAAWLLAEFFTRAKRMALPSIVLLVAFVGAVFLATILFFLGDHWLREPWSITNVPGVIYASLAATAAAALHYRRFRVPITIAAGAAALAGLGVSLSFLVAPEFTRAALNPLLLLCGVLIFAAAMWFDARDPSRLTRNTDIAFWLHLLAAPLIVHPLISTLWPGSEPISAASAWLVLAIFLALGFVAVLVNRRAVLVAGLAYAGIAFGTLIKDSFGDILLPLTLLVLGAFVLLLSAGWTRLRAALVSRLPERLSRLLPPLVAPAS